MAFMGDTTPIKRQLKYTNYAEALDRCLDRSKPRHHVRRISFIITIVEDDLSRADDVVEPLSTENQKVLNWQARTENLQNDVEVRDDLTYLSGRICPYKNISLSLYDKVTDHDVDTHQQRIGRRPLSSYRHVSFRTAMLTKHSGPAGEIQLLFSSDGLPGDRSCLRWRSHDYIKLVFPEARSSYRVFWLVQWDVVVLSDLINDARDAIIGPGIGRGIPWRPCLDRSASDQRRQGDGGKFYGIRYRKKRKSPWIAEVRPKSLRDKISLGSYKSPEVAARAVDVGLYYYDQVNKLNFRDSPWFLEDIPLGLNDKEKELFVKARARRQAEMPPSTWIPESRFYNRNTEGVSSSQPWNISSGMFNYGSDNMQPATNANFAGLPRSYGFDTSPMDMETNLHVQPSTSFGSNGLQETVGSSPEENPWLSTSNDSLTTASQVSAEVLYPELSERAYTYEPSLTPTVRNCTSGESMDYDVFNVFTHSTVWDGNSDPDISDMIAESVQAEPNGDYGRDMDLFPWL